MSVVTLKINEKTKLGKAILDLLISTSKESSAIEFIVEKTIYDAEFVKMIEKSKKQIKDGQYKTIDTYDIWGSLGL
ncbi:MAG: hypothetical protein HYU67_09770 [Flavobacteriia bacterium]|nr:hypothetical protein [Flavobacteriia bacterium]